MGHIAPRGSDGSCCTCAEWESCECGAGNCGLTCESKSGTAYLCGFDEFTDVSTPPRFYKRKAFSGAVDWTIRNTNCSGSVRCEFTDTLQGSIEKDPNDSCEETSTAEYERTAESGAPGSGLASGAGTINGNPGTWNLVYSIVKNESNELIITYDTSGTSGGGIYLSAQFCCGSGPNGLFPSGGVISADMEVVAIYTNAGNILVLSPTFVIKAQETCPQTSGAIDSLEDYPKIARFDIDETRLERTATPSGSACQNTGTAGEEITNSPELVEALEDEDTEDDAEARAAALIGAWEACTEPCVCTTLSAFRELRETGNSFSFRSVRVKANGTDLTPSTSYTVRIRFFRRVYGTSGPYLLHSVAETSVATGPGETTAETDWVDVPNEAGWETIAGSCRFITV